MADDVFRRHQVQVSGLAHGRTLLFAHGFGCDQAIWHDVAPAFEADHRVVLYDHAGCGGAQRVPEGDLRHATLDGYAEDLLDIVHALDAPELVLVGHSIGAIIGLLASLRAPDRFQRLALVAPSPRFLDDPPGYVGGFSAEDMDGLFDLMEANRFGWAQFLAPMAMGEHNPAALSREFEARLCALDPTQARRFAALSFYVDVRERLPQVTVPSLLIQCTRDSIAPRSVGHFMHARMAHSRIVEIDASGHCPHVSHPALVIDALRGELAAMDAALA